MNPHRRFVLAPLAIPMALALVPVGEAGAVVLCRNKGRIFVRDTACKKKERAVTLADLGLPAGVVTQAALTSQLAGYVTQADLTTQLASGTFPRNPVTQCAPDAVAVGAACVDKYEASVWQIPPTNTELVQKVRSGTVTLADLTGGGATPLAPAGTCLGPSDYGINLPDTGNWIPVLGSSPPSPGVYAVSIPGVMPSACITWFQAAQACALSGKRLLANQEWQQAAAGTPDPGGSPGPNDCNTNSAGPVNTGSRGACVSQWGVFDMVGNVWEWVGDWSDQANGCTHWSSGFGSDASCFGGPGSGASNLPGALVRGGLWYDGPNAGVFAVLSLNVPSNSFKDVGFRCAR